MSISIEQLKRIIEAALMTSTDPINHKGLCELFAEEENINKEAISAIIKLLQEDYSDRGVELVEVASGFRFQACADLAPWLQKMREEKPGKYSRALLETLSLIAYKQPITRGDIEDIRGVAVSTDIIHKLETREWIRVIGHKEVPGRPALYATTAKFLDDLNLKSIADLPTLADLKDLDQAGEALSEQLHLEITPETEAATEVPPTVETVEDVIHLAEASDDSRASETQEYQFSGEESDISNAENIAQENEVFEILDADDSDEENEEYDLVDEEENNIVHSEIDLIDEEENVENQEEYDFDEEELTTVPA